MLTFCYFSGIATLCFVCYRAARSDQWAINASRALTWLWALWTLIATWACATRRWSPEGGMYLFMVVIFPAMLFVFVNWLSWLFRPILPPKSR